MGNVVPTVIATFSTYISFWTCLAHVGRGFGCLYIERHTKPRPLETYPSFLKENDIYNINAFRSFNKSIFLLLVTSFSVRQVIVVVVN